jgi:hypothetical protein
VGRALGKYTAAMDGVAVPIDEADLDKVGSLANPQPLAVGTGLFAGADFFRQRGTQGLLLLMFNSPAESAGRM